MRHKPVKRTRHELQFAAEAAREAGALLRGLGERRLAAEVKHSDIDLVTEADRRSEALLLERLSKEFPDCAFLAEEGGGREAASGGAARARWIIDPLDGTTNFAHGFPHYSVSIALEEDGVVTLGLVYDVCKGELFAAERGLGAWLNGKPIRVSAVGALSKALLATGFPYDRKTSEHNNLDHYARMKMRCHGIRRAGSASLDLCYVAAGRLDGYWEMKLKPWDVAAGALVVLEAGGALSDLRGGPFDWTGASTIASNARIHGEIATVLAEGALP
jgi:myo-inositol-1(or 4)-monophosphatase